MNFWLGMAVGGSIVASLVLFCLCYSDILRFFRPSVVLCNVCGKPITKHAPDCLLLEIDRLRSALAFYADPTHYDSDAWAPDDITDDGGRRARAALIRLNGHNRE